MFSRSLNGAGRRYFPGERRRKAGSASLRKSTPSVGNNRRRATEFGGFRPCSPERSEVWITECFSSGEIEQNSDILSDEEIRTGRRFRHSDDRQRYWTARIIAKRLASRKIRDLNTAARLEFNYNAHGKPELKPVKQCSFNIAHSGQAVVVALGTTARIGVDVEPLDAPEGEDFELPLDMLADSEQQRLKSLDPATRRNEFILLWTLKEAHMKANGAGFGQGLDDFQLDWILNRSDQVIETVGDRFETRAVEIGGRRYQISFATESGTECASWHLWNHENSVEKG